MAGLFTAMLALVGCTTASPVKVDKTTLSTDVTVAAQVAVTEAAVTFDWTLTNSSSEAVWVVRWDEPPAISDESPDGVVVAAVFFPVRTDVQYVQPPTLRVVKVDAGASAQGAVTAGRPFEAFSDQNGDRAVALPGNPKTARVCFGYVPVSALGPSDVQMQSDDHFMLTRAQAYGKQKLACSAPTALR